MNRIPVVNKNNLAEGELIEVSEGFIIEHLNGIVKPKEGDSLKGLAINDGLIDLELIKLTQEKAQLKIIRKLHSIPRRNVDIVVGLSRPQTMKKVIEHLSASGVRRIIIFKAQLSEKSYLQSKIFNDEFLEHLTLLGTCQSGQFSSLPEIIIKKNLNEFMKWDADNHAQKFMLSLNSERMLNQTAINFKSPMRFVFGPERGLTRDEEEYFLHNDYEDLKISDSILRVENAVISLMGQTELLRVIRQKPDETL